MWNRSPSLAVIAVACSVACHQNPGDPANASSSSSSGDEPTTIVPSEASTSATQTSSEATSSGGTADSGESDSGSDTGAPTSACDEYDEFVAALEQAEDDTDRLQLATDFVALAQYSEHGLPLRCDGRLVVLAWHDDTSVLTVTGDFADWDPAAHPLAPAYEGLALHVADIAVDEPLAPSLYKLVVDGSEYVADPLARRFGWDEFGEYSLTDTRDDAGHHERWPAFAEGAGTLQARDVVVYVPAGAFVDAPLAVLYMHDGQNLFAPDAFFGGWRVGEAVEAARASGALPPALVVGIDNTAARFEEYTHVEDDIGGGLVGGRADEYADFVALGVKPFVDARYPTRSERESTAVLGSSLGGLVSLYIGARHPDVFAAAGSMSGTLGWGQIGRDNQTMIELYEADPPGDLWIYLDSGGGGPCPGGADNYCVTIEMRDRLLALGWSEPASLVYLHAPGAQHDEAAWAARLPAFLAGLGDRWMGN